ncbi:FecR family protein [Polaribacter cellanae]|uniref:FecR domain-containing protein n=1 Tax=Polaribacter cellanae TaxID=2818493 RepID=A0A975H6K5_9FLAO|nr:FecR domain-containing protein [Polaribacter cellanae]QTE22561.1 FecR domain-containing protein [Polaribacter cellanae]
MVPEKIKNIIVKYLGNQAFSSEIEELEKWLEKDDNEKYFTEYVKVNFIIDLNFKKFNTLNSETKLLNLISREKKMQRLRRVKLFYRYVAVIVVFFSLAYFYTKKETINTAQQNITLKMDNGNIRVVEEQENANIKDKDGNVLGSQKGNVIEYNPKNKIEKLVYNTLTVPYGKRFVVKLSDGTKVNLNAGTSLRYPVKFLKGKKRQVFIENGEAFFNVTKDKKHPFIVSNKNLNIKVLGTKFNVSSYPEDKNIATVLVEGSVSLYVSNDIYEPKKATLLKPGYKADFSKKKASISIEKADVEVCTAWIDGRIILKHMKFNDIIKKLERHYNVKIINNNKFLGEEFITATFDIETIEQVFEAINELHPIKFKINKNQIIIN